MELEEDFIDWLMVREPDAISVHPQHHKCNGHPTLTFFYIDQPPKKISLPSMLYEFKTGKVLGSETMIYRKDTKRSWLDVDNYKTIFKNTSSHRRYKTSVGVFDLTQEYNDNPGVEFSILYARHMLKRDLCDTDYIYRHNTLKISHVDLTTEFKPKGLYIFTKDDYRPISEDLANFILEKNKQYTEVLGTVNADKPIVIVRLKGGALKHIALVTWVYKFHNPNNRGGALRFEYLDNNSFNCDIENIKLKIPTEKIEDYRRNKLNGYLATRKAVLKPCKSCGAEVDIKDSVYGQYCSSTCKDFSL